MKSIIDTIREYLGLHVHKATTAESIGLSWYEKVDLELHLEDKFNCMLPEASEASWITFGDLVDMMQTAIAQGVVKGVEL